MGSVRERKGRFTALYRAPALAARRFAGDLLVAGGLLAGEDDPDVPEAHEQVRVSVARAILAVIARGRDPPQHAHSAGHRAEWRVQRRQLGVLPDGEGLAAGGVA